MAISLVLQSAEAVEAYMTPNENMQINVTRCRNEIFTFKRSFAGQRKMMKSLSVFCAEWK
jgi:hypothetical protein